VALADDANARLERQVENQAVCASAQRADLGSLRKIFDESRANFEKATKGSRLFAASTAYEKAFRATVAIKQAKALDREIDKVNATNGSDDGRPERTRRTPRFDGDHVRRLTGVAGSSVLGSSRLAASRLGAVMRQASTRSRRSSTGSIRSRETRTHPKRPT